MHRSLGLAGGAGGVEPEAEVIARCRRGDVIARCAGQNVFEQREAVPLAVASGARNDDVLEVRARSDKTGEARIKLFRHDQNGGAAVGQHKQVVVCVQQRIDGHCDDTGLDGAEERDRPVDGVGEADEDALLPPHLERPQHIRKTRHPLGELPISPDAARIDIRRLTGAPGCEIAVQNIRGEIVVARDAIGRAGGRL